MMLRMFITAIVTVIILNTLYGQRKIYLVSGTPFNYQLRYPERYPIIFSLDAELKTLDTTLVVRRDSSILVSINMSHKSGQVFLYEESLYPRSKKYLTSIDLTSLSKKSIELNFSSNSRQINILNYDSCRHRCLMMHFGGDGYFCFDSQLRLVKKDQSITKHVSIEGSHGISINNLEVLPVVLNNDSQYECSLRRYDRESPVILNEQPPLSIQSESGTFRYFDALVVNNEYVTAFITNNSVPDANSMGTVGYYILNKIDSEWQYREFKGGSTLIDAFDNFIVGHVSDYNRGIYYPERGKNLSYDFRRILIGQASRRPLFQSLEEQTRLQDESESFDERAMMGGKTFPGILFYLNVLTNEYHEWQTDQADSEILLVTDQNIYYRIDDSLFTANIGQGGLYSIKLLYKDDRLRDVHWLFLMK